MAKVYPPGSIVFTSQEQTSGYNRIRFAEDLIRKLPLHHEGRNTWLINYGSSEEANVLRQIWEERTGEKVPQNNRQGE